jgi:hypothetical protein
MDSVPAPAAPRTPLSVTAALKAKRPQQRHSETSPLLGSIAASKNVPGWGTLVRQLDRESMLDETVSDSGQHSQADKNSLNINGEITGRPRVESPFGMMESGRASPMGESFGQSES